MENNFNGEIYENFVKSMAFYPHSGENNIASLLYPIFGLNGEFGEAVEKLTIDSRYSTFDKVKELGDVLWYYTRVSHELNYTLTELIEASVLQELELSNNLKDLIITHIIYSGNVCELAKKALRDGGGELTDPVDNIRREEIFKNLSKSFKIFTRLCEVSGSDLEQVAMVNVDKLTSRKDRGKLNGDGDDR